MTYILDQTGKGKSYLVSNNRITYIASDLSRYQYMRVNLGNFYMTPGLTYVDWTLMEQFDFADYKQQQKKSIEKGCTTQLVVCKVQYEREIEQKIKEAKHAMINSSLDFAIGLSIPLERLKSSVIRICRKNRIPFIVTEVNEMHDIQALPWGWIRDALYSYKLPIYPLWRTEDPKQKKWQMQDWDRLTTANHVPTDMDFPEQPEPLKKHILKQIGLYPVKGELLIRSDLDYNLFYKDKVELVEQSKQIDYHKDSPDVTVLRGKQLKYGETIKFYPGYGQELNISVPGHFV